MKSRVFHKSLVPEEIVQMKLMMLELRRYHNAALFFLGVFLHTQGRRYLLSLVFESSWCQSIDLPLPSPSSCSVSSMGRRLFLRSCSFRSY